MDALQSDVYDGTAIGGTMNSAHSLSTPCAGGDPELELDAGFYTSYPQLCGKPTTWRFTRGRATIGARIEGTAS